MTSRDSWVMPDFSDEWKAKCKSCKFLDSLHADVFIMRCSALEKPSKRRPNYCIDHRDPGAACGPTAVLWQPAA